MFSILLEALGPYLSATHLRIGIRTAGSWCSQSHQVLELGSDIQGMHSIGMRVEEGLHLDGLWTDDSWCKKKCVKKSTLIPMKKCFWIVLSLPDDSWCQKKCANNHAKGCKFEVFSTPNLRIEQAIMIGSGKKYKRYGRTWCGETPVTLTFYAPENQRMQRRKSYQSQQVTGVPVSRSHTTIMLSGPVSAVTIHFLSFDTAVAVMGFTWPCSSLCTPVL